MKIGLDGRAAKWYRGTGIGTYTHQLIDSINSLDNLNKYMIFMPQCCSNDINFKSNFKIVNITENEFGNFWDEVNIPNILEQGDVDIYHVPQNGVGLPEKKDCALTITLHDIIPYKMPETVSERYLKIFHEEIPSIVSRCDGIITVSNFSKNDIANAFNFPKEKIFVTYLASEKIYMPLDKELCKKILVKNYDIDGDYLLYVGGFSPRKNILGLIQAFSKVVKKFPDLSLVIAGKKGISYDLYKAEVEKYNLSHNVIFPGFIPLEDLPILYNGAEIFVYPSFYEGFGLPPLEAMACGTPVIASNVTSIPEILDDSALLISPHDIEELYHAIINILEDEDLRQKLILKGIIKNSEFSWKNTAEKTIIAYNKMTNNF